MATIIPMAGTGSRFSKEGYLLPKPLIPVSGEPMIARVIQALPRSGKLIFLVREEHIQKYGIQKVIKGEAPDAIIVPVKGTTQGQASTCMLAMPYVEKDEEVLIASCDNSFLYNKKEYAKLTGDNSNDAVVWTFTKNRILEEHPEAWGWVILEEDGKAVKGMSVKKPVSGNPYNDHAVVASFYFRRAADFQRAYNSMVSENYRIGSEYYVDAMPLFLKKMGKRSVIFDVELYVGWGKPSDLYLYQLWEHRIRHNITPENSGERREYLLWKKFFESLRIH